jgi:hypothetical protein
MCTTEREENSPELYGTLQTSLGKVHKNIYIVSEGNLNTTVGNMPIRKAMALKDSTL